MEEGLLRLSTGDAWATPDEPLAFSDDGGWAYALTSDGHVRWPLSDGPREALSNSPASFDRGRSLQLDDGRFVAECASGTCVFSEDAGSYVRIVVPDPFSVDAGTVPVRRPVMVAAVSHEGLVYWLDAEGRLGLFSVPLDGHSPSEP